TLKALVAINGDPAFASLVTRERAARPGIPLANAASLSDVEWLMAYALARAQVPRTTLDQIYATGSSSPEVSSLAKFVAAYSEFVNAANDSSSWSLRVVADSLAALSGHTPEQATLLRNAFQSTSLTSFGLLTQDVDLEVLGSLDPDF